MGGQHRSVYSAQHLAALSFLSVCSTVCIRHIARLYSSQNKNISLTTIPGQIKTDLQVHPANTSREW